MTWEWIDGGQRDLLWRGFAAINGGMISRVLTGLFIISGLVTNAAELSQRLAPFFEPPAEYRNDFGQYSSLLKFKDGTEVKTAADWKKRRAEIYEYWTKVMGPWPPLIEKPEMKVLEEKERENFKQQKVSVEVAPGQMQDGYLLTPSGEGPFPAVLVVYYEPETSVGLSTNRLRDFAYQLTKRGFVTLSIGTPGGNAWKPELGQAKCQPLHYHGYVSANCANLLGNLPQVDKARIGVTGHSYGGKWAMFSAAFYEKFACAAWSDPGSVWDEKRPNVNYWEPWYLGWDPNVTRPRGVIRPEAPRTGAYKKLVEVGHDLHEVMALIAPRPFLVSGGSEDPPERWLALNRVRGVYDLLEAKNRVGMTNRPHHNPTEESNEVIYEFFEAFLKKSK